MKHHHTSPKYKPLGIVLHILVILPALGMAACEPEIYPAIQKSVSSDGGAIKYPGYAPSSAAEIKSFYCSSVPGIFSANNTITVTGVPYSQWSGGLLSPTINISEGASIYPASKMETNFSSGPVIYTVTAADGSSKKNYTVTVTPPTASSDTDIKAFSLPGVTGKVEVEYGADAITVKVPYGTALTSLSPQITLFSSATTISPASGVSQNFTSTIEYTVTAENNDTKKWNVTVKITDVYSTITEVESFLSNNTGSSMPINLPVSLNLANTSGNGWTDLLKEIKDWTAASGTVNLDLSKCTVPSNGVFDPGTGLDGKDKIVSLVLPETATSTANASSTFTGFIALTEVTGKNIKTIGVSTFQGCTTLTTANFPAATSIGNYAFSGCTVLTKLELPGNPPALGSGVFSGTYNSSNTTALSIKVPTGTVSNYTTPNGWNVQTTTSANNSGAADNYGSSHKAITITDQ